MAGRNGRYLAALGGIAVLLLMGAAPVAPSAKPQSAPKNAPGATNADRNGGDRMGAYERESLAASRVANGIAERANVIADAQRRYGFWSLILAALGVAFTGIAAFFAYRATHWAKDAAAHTKRSADADNEALTETRNAAAAARQDALDAAERFRAQIADSREMVEFTAKSAYAMEHGANASRSLAIATREAAAKQLRPYLYLTEERFMYHQITGGGGRQMAVDALFAIRNFGQTPAKRVRFRAATFLGGYWSEDFAPDLDGAVWIHWSDVPPGHSRPMDDPSAYRCLGFSDQDVAHVTDDSRAFFFHGVIEYEDGDGKAYKTHFRRAATGLNFWIRAIVTEGGNDAD